MEAERVVVPAHFFVQRSSGLSGSGYGTRYAADTATAASAVGVGGSSGSGPSSPSQRDAKVEELVEDLDMALQAEERRVDMLLLLAKCSVPALFVAIGGAVAFPADAFLTDGMRRATEEAGGCKPGRRRGEKVIENQERPAGRPGKVQSGIC